MRRALAAGLIAPVFASAAVFTAKLQPETITAWDRYVEQAEHRRPTVAIGESDPVLIDLNPNGDVPSGYIHHWVGAIRIPNATVASVRGVLEDYDAYSRVYAPDLKAASASKIGQDAYDVQLITERWEGVGLRFAFDIRSKVNFHADQVDSRSYSIRESNSGKPPYNDLLPEGNDHGILWRLNSYWRLRQAGPDVQAECEVISLSRKPLFGMGTLVKTRARDSLAATLKQTRDRATSR